MLSLHTNAASLSTQNALSANNKGLTSSMTKLGTGFRINSAMDDAAGLQIANRLKAQNSGMAVAMRNTQNGISLMQTAEGALNEVNTMLVRMKDLATQSADASASVADKEAMQAEYDSLGSEIANIIGNTTFGGEKLMNQKTDQRSIDLAKLELDGLKAQLGVVAPLTQGTAPTATVAGVWTTAGTATLLAKDKDDAEVLLLAAKEALRISTAADQTALIAEVKTAQAGFDAANQIFVDKQAEITAAQTNYDKLLTASKTEGKLSTAIDFQIGSTSSETMGLDVSSSLANMHATLNAISAKYSGNGVSQPGAGNELTTNANATIDLLQKALDEVGNVRSDLGAASNRLEHTNANLGSMSSTTSAAIGRIMDVDYATETTNMTKNQMLMQASSAMLKQSNSMSQMVASLLQ